MDKRKFMLANALLKNEINTPVIEFAYKASIIRIKWGQNIFCNYVDVKFEIIKIIKKK